MIDIHLCSYYCHHPECIKFQRDELHGKLESTQWKSLTSAERKALWLAANSPGEFGQLIEAKLKEKNT